MNTISSFSVKLTALQMAIEAKSEGSTNILDDAQAIYDWLAAEIEFGEQGGGTVSHLTPVN